MPASRKPFWTKANTGGAPCAIGRDGYAVALAIPENEAPRPIIRHRLEIPFR